MCIKFKDTDDEPFAEFDEQEKRDTLVEGLFWFIRNDNTWNYRYLCDKNST